MSSTIFWFPDQPEGSSRQPMTPLEYLNSKFSMRFSETLQVPIKPHEQVRNFPAETFTQTLEEFWRTKRSSRTLAKSLLYMFEQSIERMIELRVKNEKMRAKVTEDIKQAETSLADISRFSDSFALNFKRNICLTPHSKSNKEVAQANDIFIQKLNDIKVQANTQILNTFIASSKALLQDTLSDDGLDLLIEKDFAERFTSFCDNVNTWDSCYVVVVDAATNHFQPLSYFIRELAKKISREEAHELCIDRIFEKNRINKAKNAERAKESAAQAIVENMNIDNPDFNKHFDDLVKMVTKKVQDQLNSKDSFIPKNQTSPGRRGRSPSRRSKSPGRQKNQSRQGRSTSPHTSRSPGRRRSHSRSQSPSRDRSKSRSPSPGQRRFQQPKEKGNQSHGRGQSTRAGILKTKHSRDQQSPSSSPKRRKFFSRSPTPPPQRNQKNTNLNQSSGQNADSTKRTKPQRSNRKATNTHWQQKGEGRGGFARRYLPKW